MAGLNATTELLSAANGALGFRLERLVEDYVVHAEASVWAPRIAITGPGRFDIVEPIKAAAHEEIQALALASFAPGLGHGVGLWGLEWYSDAPRTGLLLPEFTELLAEFCVVLMDNEARRYTDILEPYAGVDSGAENSICAPRNWN